MREGANTKTSDEGRGGVAGAGEDIPLQPREQTTAKQVVPLKPGENLSGADIHPEDDGGPYATAGECGPKEVGISWRAHAEAGSWQEMKRSPGRGAHTGAGFLAGDVTPRGTEAGIVHP